MRLVSLSSDLTTPVAQRTRDGVFVGHDGEVWLYLVMPNDPLQWEDSAAREEVALRYETLLTEIGRHSRMGTPGLRQVRRKPNTLREIHLLSLAWDEAPTLPLETTAALRNYQERLLREARVFRGLTAFGVRLKRSSFVSKQNTSKRVKQIAEAAQGHKVDLSPYHSDLSLMRGILERAGGKPPTREEARRLEFWWNGGQGSEARIVQDPDGLALACSAWPGGLEFAALIDFEDAQLDPRRGLWLNDIFSANEGCVCVSIRGDVFPADSINALIRKTRRRAREQINENAVTGDVDRGEDEELAYAAKSMEEYFRTRDEPLLRNVSIISARQGSPATHSYRDLLQQKWGIETKVIESRQIKALWETLPCGPQKFRFEKPFAQDVSIGAIASSGVTSFSEVGDKQGAWIGMALSDSSPIWLDPMGASTENTAAAMAVVGESGSGKTFLLQLIATQCAFAGRPVVFINPKPADSLAPFAAAVGGETIRMSSSRHNPGALDPFRFTRTPEDAAAIASSHIQSVLDLEQEEVAYLTAGLRQAAIGGAECVGAALEHELVPEHVRRLVRVLCEGQPLFAQGISDRPLPRKDIFDVETALAGQGSLTLIEFDRSLSLPSSLDRRTHTPDERIAMAAVRLVCSVALESMFAAGGGVLIVDEAHVLMGSEEGRKILTRLGREGRSQRILPILATQLLHDIMEGDANMVSHLSRIAVLKMRDPKEVVAALKLLRLEPTEDRISWLNNAGPIRGERGSLGFYRDLQDRVSGFIVGPVPHDIEMLLSTNALDRDAREKDPAFQELVGAER